ncbi:hypothetical protein Bca101_065021 [Brassica carinata]
MKSSSTKVNINNNNNGVNHQTTTNRFLPNSLKFISSCIKTASSGVRSASASVAASLSADSQELKDQVLWSSFDRLHTSESSFKNVLLLGYANGFQVLDLHDASDVSELVSRRDDPVTFLQMQPLPARCEGVEGFRSSHPMLLAVADESNGSVRNDDPLALSPTVVRFYSLRSHNYVHVLRFRSTVYMVRCSPRIVAVGLGSQIYCFDALTLENKFSVLSYPVPQLGSNQGISEVNVGYGPMSVGPRWLAYASNGPLSSSLGRLSPQNVTPGVSPSTSPSGGNLVARYAMESSKHLAAGLLNLGDKGIKTLSKYCQDLKHDGPGSSSLSSSPGWKVGRAASSAESDFAGTVIVKDFESRATIAHFRAHTSPISALCFDPSGTLLVTASIHGNNINVFRIMPSKNGPGAQTYDWSSSHVPLYKLHRGMTSAVIQDICFSSYSQWIAIVSSKGTCHIYVLSPFGGETVLEIRNSHVDGPTLAPTLSLPWWSSPSFTTTQFSFPPPASVTLSVVTRIKCNSFFHAASSVVGKPSFPSGCLAAVFHQSVPLESQSSSADRALDYLLVYTPSGHVVQYKLIPSLGGDKPDSNSAAAEEELRVKVEPLQCWDVCRKTNWPEREENICGLTFDGRKIVDTSDSEDLAKPLEKHHVYLANAEVLINSGRKPIWQNSEISFYPMFNDVNLHYHGGGEIEIEKLSANEVDIRKKDLLPVFDNFHSVYSSMRNRGFSVERDSDSSSDPGQVKGMANTENEERSGSITFKQPVVSMISAVKDSDYTIDDGHLLLKNASLPAETTIENSSGTSGASNVSSNRSDLSMNAGEESEEGCAIDGSPDFQQFFKETAKEAEDKDDPPDQRKLDDDDVDDADDDDDMLGGVFAFSEEGKNNSSA